MPTINISLDDVKKSATTYNKELLVMPVVAANATLKHMTPMAGIAGRHVISALDGDTELGPYDPNRAGSDDIQITSRILETFLGNAVEKFDLNYVTKTVYGHLNAQGQQLTSVNIARAILNLFAAKLGEKLNMAIWAAKRNPSGRTTKDLFDGFDTITEQEITSSKISAQNGNYQELAAITPQNAFDVLNDFYEASDEVLQSIPTKLYVPRNVFNAYRKSCLDNLGAVVYNTGYEKPTLVNSNGLCELVPLASKAKSKFIHLGPQSNFVYGYGDGMADEKIEIEKFHEFLVSFIATMFFGVQFRSVDKEMLCVGKLTQV